MATGSDDFPTIENEDVHEQVTEQQTWATARGVQAATRSLREAREGRLSHRDAERRAAAARVDMEGRSN